jgi:hypothetical protein
MIKQKAVSDYFTNLGFNDKLIKDTIEKDKESRKLFIKGKNKIPRCSNQKHRIELLKLSQSIYELFVLKLINRLYIIIEIKTKAVIDYWFKKDKLRCDCRNKAFGFCFHKDNKGNYFY